MTPPSPAARFDLDRFVAAQARDYAGALAELQAGQKQTHWIWYVLPQLRGLGRSEMAHRFGIESLAEARAYLAHPLLGPRLNACIAALMAHSSRSATEMLGDVDALKFRSCLTLFGAAAPDEPLFRDALDRFFDGRPDERTQRLLRAPET
jgi:uncharacterized protein (DUF1810 family)